jgi:hypothetical protein
VKRLLLWSVALAVMLAAVLVYLRAREASRGRRCVLTPHAVRTLTP